MTASHRTTWLRGNHRLMWLSLSLPAVILFVGLGLLVWGLLGELLALRIAGGVVIGVAIVFATMIARTGRLPRIQLGSNSVDLYLPGPRPISVPLEYVECFFLGTGVTPLPGQAHRDVQTRNIVVRLAERATEWQHREMPLSMGKWCEGYVTIRGLYCEPIDVGTVQNLNVLLHEAQQAAKGIAKAGPVDAAKPECCQHESGQCAGQDA